MASLAIQVWAVLLLAVSLLILCNAEHSCENNEHGKTFACANGTCIYPEWVCDTDNDCGDHSDERDCECSEEEGFYRCGDSERCIISYRICDGEQHCPNGDDEVDCPTTTRRPTTTRAPCPSGYIPCKNNKYNCIRERWVCDGDNDCGDFSDEEGCPCRAGQHTCSNGRCISLSSVCDKVDDCGDNSDENDCDTCPQDFRPLKSNDTAVGCYKLLLTSNSWFESEEICTSLGARLAVIDDEDQNSAIKNYLSSLSYDNLYYCEGRLPSYGSTDAQFFIGGRRLHDGDCESPYFWQTAGTHASVSFDDWQTNEPSCHQYFGVTRESCITMRRYFSYQWNDVPCELRMCAVCQADPVK